MRNTELESRLIQEMKVVQKNNLIVLLDDITESKNSGLIIAPTADWALREKVRVGTVIAVGEKVDLKPKDRLIINKGYGVPIAHLDSDKHKLILISENQVEAVITGDAERDDFDVLKEGFK